MAGLSSAELVEFLAACQAGIRALEAARTLALARLAATEEVVTEDGCVQEVSQGLGYRRLDAPDLVSSVLGVCAQAAAARVDDAVVLAAKLPLVVDAMGAGRVDAYRAGIIAGELREAPRAVCDAVLARIDGSLGQPGGVLRRRTRRALEIVDPDWLVTKALRARSDLGLRMVPNGDSTDTWTAILPTEQSRHAWAGIEPLAKQLRDTQGITLDQARAQAMTQLILGHCSGTFHLHLAVPTDQAHELAARLNGQPGRSLSSAAADDVGDGAVLAPYARDGQIGTPPAVATTDIASRSLGRDGGLVAAGKVNDWAVVTGLGTPGTTIVPGDWLSKVVAGQHGTVTVDVIGCDPTTGGFTTNRVPVPVSVRSPGKTGPAQQPRSTPALSTDAYRPTPAIRAYVKARDQYCRFPGCSTSAYYTDLDHVRPWPAGPTQPDNLACLCRRHHRVKQRPGWTARLNPDASMDWTDPTGRTRTTHPVDHLDTTLPTNHLRDLPVRRPSATLPTDPATHSTVRSTHETAPGEAPFGDPLWDGDYQDTDAYTGGLPVWLRAERDLRAGFEALDRWHDLPLADRYPDVSPALLILYYEASWTGHWRDGPPEPQPRSIHWLAS